LTHIWLRDCCSLAFFKAFGTKLPKSHQYQERNEKLKAILQAVLIFVDIRLVALPTEIWVFSPSSEINQEYVILHLLSGSYHKKYL